MIPFYSFLAAVPLLLVADRSAYEDVQPDTRYYVLLFGGQSGLLKPTTGHVWATYVRETGCPAGARRVEEFTISWLPVTGRVRPAAVRPEPGINHTLEGTMQILCGPRSRIGLWGPYEISECRFNQAIQQKALLESGAVLYKLLDGRTHGDVAYHCLHAITAGHPDVHERCRVVLRWGERAAALAASAMLSTSMISDPDATHEWLLPALGLDPQRFVRRMPADRIIVRR